MVVEVYADLLFFLNAGMDALCFCLTASILHRKLSRWRLALGAVLGGVYAVASLFIDLTALPFAQVWAVAIDAAVCLLLSAVVFGRKGERTRRVLGAAAMYTVVSMVMGGVMTALYNLLNRLDLPFLTVGDEGSSLSAILFAVLAGVGGLVTAGGGRIFRQKQSMVVYGVTVELNGQIITVEGMVDSGNLLRDPIGGKPVVVMDTAAVAPLLAPAWATVIASGGVRIPETLSVEDRRRIRLIPTGTATGRGLLVALAVDRLILTPEGGASREVDALMGLSTLDSAPAAAMIPSELASSL